MKHFFPESLGPKRGCTLYTAKYGIFSLSFPTPLSMNPHFSHVELSDFTPCDMCFVLLWLSLHTPFALNVPSTILVLLGEFTTRSFNIQDGINLFSDDFTD